MFHKQIDNSFDYITQNELLKDDTVLLKWVFIFVCVECIIV